MPNSDNKYGTYNKKTFIITQNDHLGDPDSDSTAATPTTFANVNAAKAHFYTTEALTVMDECCTVLEWALIEDNTGLKQTFAFGTKGNSDIAEADDWAGQYNSRKTALINANGWVNDRYPKFTVTESSDHLV